jgi:hypothetical protein
MLSKPINPGRGTNGLEGNPKAAIQGFSFLLRLDLSSFVTLRVLRGSCFRPIESIFLGYPYSQTEFLIFASSGLSPRKTSNSPFVFIGATVSFIRSIDFFSKNFSDRTKRNNQLDTRFGSQYFLSH